jgi:uncharacterized protein
MSAAAEPELLEDIQNDECDQFVFSWWLGEEMHRTDGPSVIARHGTTFSETYTVHNTHHREHGPAVLEMDSDTGATRVFWHRHGKMHREGGPAVVVVNGDGVLERREWWVDGVLVRSEANI